jgi:hypothetical protein
MKAVRQRFYGLLVLASLVAGVLLFSGASVSTAATPPSTPNTSLSVVQPIPVDSTLPTKEKGSPDSPTGVVCWSYARCLVNRDGRIICDYSNDGGWFWTGNYGYDGHGTYGTYWSPHYSYRDFYWRENPGICWNP